MLSTLSVRRALCAPWAAAALWGGVVAADAQAQSPSPPAYPVRAITLIVPYSTGTTADTLARLLGAKLSERWGVPVITENRAGAAGVIGSDAVAKAAPDGHTLMFTATSHSTVPAVRVRLPFDPIKAFAPVLPGGTRVILAEHEHIGVMPRQRRRDALQPRAAAGSDVPGEDPQTVSP